MISHKMLDHIIPVRVSGSLSSSCSHLRNTSSINFSEIESNSKVWNLSFEVLNDWQRREIVVTHSFWIDSSKELKASFFKWFQIISQKCLITCIGSSVIIHWRVFKLSFLVNDWTEVSLSKTNGNAFVAMKGEAAKKLFNRSFSSFDVILNLSFFGGSNSIG